MNRKKTLWCRLHLREIQETHKAGKFLAEMEQVVPLEGTLLLIEPFYPKRREKAVLPSVWSGCSVHFLQG